MCMSVLYIYGDSYANDEPTHQQWFKQLGYTAVVNRARAGAANDYIAHQLWSDRELHTENDCVLVVATHNSRQWFFEDRPEIGNYLGIQDLEQQTTAQEFTALRQYVTHLLNPLQDTARGRAYWSYFNDCVAHSPAQGLVIPGFDTAESVTGVLTDITAGEFTNGGTLENYYENIVRVWGTPEDPRANHMMPENHTVLAQKIRAALEGEHLDLTKGFHQDCLEARSALR